MFGGIYLSVMSTAHCDYTTGYYLPLVSFSPFFPLLFYIHMTPRNSWVPPRRSQIHYSLVWNTFIWPTLHILWVSAYIDSTSQAMFPGSLIRAGAPEMCSLSTCVARPTIFMTLYWLLGGSVFSVRLKAHPKSHWGRDQGCLIHHCIPNEWPISTC